MSAATAGLVLVGIIIVLAVWWVPKWAIRDADSNRFQIENEARRTILQILGGLLLVSGSIVTWKQLALTEQKEITDRFAQTVEKLGSESSAVRVGAIYTLEQMHKDNRYNRASITRLLAVYVRSSTPRDWANPKPRPYDLRQDHPDINAALEVLSRRTPNEVTGDYTSGGIDLMYTDLRGLWLAKGSVLSGATMIYSLLAPAGLEGVDLSNAWLTGSHLEVSNLRRARLVGTDLWAAYLCGAYLDDAQLQGADLIGADLRFARLEGADLTGTMLYNADLTGACGLTDAQLASALTDTDTKFTFTLEGGAKRVVTTPCGKPKWANECLPLPLT